MSAAPATGELRERQMGAELWTECGNVGDYALSGRPLSESSHHVLPGIFPATIDSQSILPWYLAPSSWELTHAPYNQCLLALGNDSLKSFVNTLRSWMKQWTSQGHCAFIHRALYTIDLPIPIQDAYTTLTAYLAKTPDTESMVLRIAKERARSLVHSQPPPDKVAIVLDTAMHLARTQALIIYTTICLFGGDISARAQAEHGLEVLLTWGYQLLWNAAVNKYYWQSYYASQSGSGASGEPVSCNGLGIRDDLNSVWCTWVFTESIRRTYLISVLLMSVYSALKAG